MLSDFSAAMPTSKFDEYECETIRHFAKLFDTGTSEILRRDFPRPKDVGSEQVERVLKRFLNLGLLYWHEEYHEVMIGGGSGKSQTLRIDARILDFAHQLDNPPPRDYWKEVETWFRGRWWSVPLVGAVVLPPILIQSFQWIYQALQWGMPLRE
jgi:hypothetical protein